MYVQTLVKLFSKTFFNRTVVLQRRDVGLTWRNTKVYLQAHDYECLPDHHMKGKL